MSDDIGGKHSPWITEKAIQARMILTLCNMLSAEAPRFTHDKPEQIKELVREIAERELKEQM